ncbi:hypothetical protein TNCV_1721671 [Trichonephila clavipes]|nr:hypothetical protein TNCV_1721671 [Trichonephila clavipes]
MVQKIQSFLQFANPTESSNATRHHHTHNRKTTSEFQIKKNSLGGNSLPLPKRKERTPFSQISKQKITQKLNNSPILRDNSAHQRRPAKEVGVAHVTQYWERKGSYGKHPVSAEGLKEEEKSLVANKKRKERKKGTIR